MSDAATFCFHGYRPGCCSHPSCKHAAAETPVPTRSAACARCKRGAEACGYCEGIEACDWEAICDCGLYDFGGHLIDCEARAEFKYVIAGDYEQAKVPRV